MQDETEGAQLSDNRRVAIVMESRARGYCLIGARVLFERRAAIREYWMCGYYQKARGCHVQARSFWTSAARLLLKGARLLPKGARPSLKGARLSDISRAAITIRRAAITQRRAAFGHQPRGYY